MKKRQVNKLLIGGGHLDQLSNDLTLFIVPYKRIGLLGFYSFSVERGTIK